MMDDYPESNLPREPEYWERLAARVTDNAAAPLAGYAGNVDAWYGPLAQRAPWVVAASTAAMLVLWLSLPTTADPVSRVFRWMERSLAPDDVAGVLVTGATPPPVQILMSEFPPALKGRQQ
jgi:hypothetical protein